jgi:hypothetical protein
MRNLLLPLILAALFLSPISHASDSCEAGYGELAPKRKYPTISMQQKFIGEDQGKLVDHTYFRITYLTEEQLEERRIVFTPEGLLNSKGDPLHLDGKYIFVMDDSGNFYILPLQKGGSFRHSSFFGGKPVASAGEMTFRDGKLVGINRMSGHYLPRKEELKNALRELERDGLELRAIWTGENKSGYDLLYSNEKRY